MLRSTLPDLALSQTGVSSFVLERARRQPDAPAHVDVASGETLSYGQLVDTIDATASSLAAHGLCPGDRVAVFGFGAPAFAVAVQAVWRAGGVVVIIDPLVAAAEMAWYLADSGVRYLLAAPETTARAVEAAGRCGLQMIAPICAACETEVGNVSASPGPPSIVRTMFAVGEGEVGLGVASIVPRTPGLHPPPQVTVDPAADAALIVYSGGITVSPEAIALTHRSLMAAISQLDSGDVAPEDDRLVAIAPFVHAAALNTVLNVDCFASAPITSWACMLPRTAPTA